MRKIIFVYLLFELTGYLILSAQEKPVTVIVKPTEIHDVLSNPGIGFTTFQRFNGDELNEGNGWTEGFPIVYQDFNGDLTNKNYPQTSIAYFRVYWRYIEPEPGQYNWPMIDKALRTAAERGQTLMLRIPPYGDKADVPDWYRKMAGKEIPQKVDKWRIDPEDPRYIQYFGGMIRTLGQRYDGHPDLESLDISLVGFWGEGEGSHLLTDQTRVALINCYLDNFKKTTLTFQPLNGDAPDPGVLVNGTSIAASWPDGRCNGNGTQTRHLGYRLDCLGDMTTDLWPKQGWSHMTDIYPKDIVMSGMGEAWKKAPVTMEICYTFLQWLEKLKYDEKTVNYIFGEALKWHISSFNAKSSGVPKVWSPLVDTWLNKMGYRFVLRKFEYPSIVTRQGQLSFTSLWENVGVAPIYKEYKLALRLKSSQKTLVLPANANLLAWLPGDIVYDETLYVPFDIPVGKYQLEVAVVSPVSFEPRIKLAISGATGDGWYPMGNILVQDK
jgi:Domain of unknown function (DUF4832)/Beta-galactosidase